MPEISWLDILKASGWKTAGVAVGCFLVVAGHNKGWWPIALDPVWVQGSFVIGVICACLAFASIFEAIPKVFSEPIRAARAWRARRRHAKQFREYIPYMLPKERAIFAQLLHQNRKAFFAEDDAGYAATLLGPRYVVVSAIPGQTASHHSVPYRIPDHIWDVAAQHRDQFPHTPDKDGGDAWRVPWMLQ